MARCLVQRMAFLPQRFRRFGETTQHTVAGQEDDDVVPEDCKRVLLGTNDDPGDSRHYGEQESPPQADYSGSYAKH